LSSKQLTHIILNASEKLRSINILLIFGL